MISATSVKRTFPAWQQKLYAELNSILTYWQTHCKDETYGGFYGKINNDNEPDLTADKGVVLTSRILWTFSAAFTFTRNPLYLPVAERAFDYLQQHFTDKLYGGVYWSVNYKGERKESRKQIYGLAFAIYGLSEYYEACGNESALDFAKDLYGCIEQYSFDSENNGYFEAFDRNWQPIYDVRLSAKDANASKTMNTHLHVIEAYANLYKVWKNEGLKQKIGNLLSLFDEHFIDKGTGHVKLFFNDEWTEQDSGIVSYGHDIEAAWLLLHCAESTNSHQWTETYRHHALNIAVAAAEGVDKDGGMWYEYNRNTGTLVKQKHWWVQAEAMIGFTNAWQLTRNKAYLQQAFDAWRFTLNHLVDKQHGEWFWGVDDAYRIMAEDKAGFWKCPYHNARACLEMLTRIGYCAEKGAL